MKHRVLKLCLGAVGTVGWLSVNAQAPVLCERPLEPVPFHKVHVEDAFWQPRMETNAKVAIPAAFRECEKNGRFDNFALAAGLKTGEHRGDFSFDDTDPYKVIEGASYALAVHYDRQLDAYVDSVVALIAAAQEPDGYLCTCVTNRCERLSGWWGTRRWEKINSHELYNCGHLYEAAVAHYQATGKRTLLDVACRNADLICRVFGPDEGQIHRPSGHPIVEMALCKLYKVTGRQEYLQLARYFVEETGRGTDGHPLNPYSQDHKPILQQDEIVGHAVRAGYLYSGVADVAALTGDTAYYRALYRLWDNLTNCKLYVTGGMGSRAQGEGFGPEYELHSHTAYCETCASIANVYWNHRMLLATGDARFADVLERALYNGVLSGVSLSGDRFFYDNPLESMGQHERQPWFGCACCPGNVVRFLASVPGYMYAVSGRDVYVNLYIPGQAEIKNEALRLKLRQDGGMPWSGDVSLTVTEGKSRACTFHLRLPSWATDTLITGSDLYSVSPLKGCVRLTVNGKEQPLRIEKGYMLVSRKWRKGDCIRIEFPMDVRRITARSEAADLRGKMALQRGPLVYCLEGRDQPDSLVFNKYLSSEVRIDTVGMSGLQKGCIALQGEARRVTEDASGHREQTVSFRAIPYYIWNNRGCDQMAVWIAASADRTRPASVPTLESKSRSVVLRAPIQKDAPASAATEEWAWGVNDGWEPQSSSDTSKPYHYWWLKNGTKETLAYVFDSPEELHSASVYWLDFDHYDGNFRVPLSWKLYYKDADEWREVEATSDYGVERDKYNTVTFRPVVTSALKMEVQLQPRQSGGVLEWKLNR